MNHTICLRYRWQMQTGLWYSQYGEDTFTSESFTGCNQTNKAPVLCLRSTKKNCLCHAFMQDFKQTKNGERWRGHRSHDVNKSEIVRGFRWLRQSPVQLSKE